MTRKQKPVNGTQKEEKKVKESFPVVGIGASAGGLEAIKQLFTAMPPDSGMAFVLVQHLDPTPESLMVDLLSRYTNIPVTQIQDGMLIRVNHIYMIPPNRDVAILKGRLHLTEFIDRRGMRMPIDFFFRSLAEDQKERSIAIVLSGTGSDGTQGVRDVKGYGGLAMVQAPKEAQYDGMPNSALGTRSVDYALPVAEMPEVLSKYISRSYISRNTNNDGLEDLPKFDVKAVLSVLQAATGHDFRCYKKSTILRRIERRMGLHQIRELDDFVALLRNNPEEIQSLFRDLLISVTGFFRESKCWEEVSKSLLPEAISRLHTGESLRIWVPACATGEEAYTLAILGHECIRKSKKDVKLQIFATDIDTDALDVARRGRYPDSIAAVVSSSRLKEFFTKDDHVFEVCRLLRETVVFSEQNIVRDPPFSKLDLISCRNLLIYLDLEMQKKLIALFHFSLRPGGFLVLGNSETVGQQENLFSTISKKWRIYRREGAVPSNKLRFPIDTLVNRLQGYDISLPDDHQGKRIMFSPAAVARDAILDLYAPASVLIDKRGRVLYFHGATEGYVRQPTGEPTVDLLSLVCDGLLTRMRTALHAAVREWKPVKVTNARVKRINQYHQIEFIISPLPSYQGTEGLLIVSFRDVTSEKVEDLKADDISPTDELTIQQLEHELKSTREELQNTIEELETGSEELKAANEEVMSMNEELQSSNEELETSKEELQSLNEELSTANNQLQDKVEELQELHDDLLNFISSTGIGTLFLDTHFNIQRFTPQAKELFTLIASDVGRPVADLSRKFDDVSLLDDAMKVLDDLRQRSETVKAHNGQWYMRRILPYRTQDKRVEGVVVTFQNVTDMKNAQAELEDLKLDLERRIHESISELKEVKLTLEEAQKMAHLGSFEYSVETKTMKWSDEQLRIYGLPSESSTPTFDEMVEKYVHPEDRELLRTTFSEAIENKSEYSLEFRITTSKEKERWLYSVAHPFFDKKERLTRYIGATLDISDRKKNEELIIRNKSNQALARKLARVGTWEWEIGTEKVKWSDEVIQIFGFDPKDFDGNLNKIINRFHPEDRQAWEDDVYACVHQGKQHNLEFRLVLPDGKIRWILGFGNVERDSNGNAVRMLGLAMDITDTRSQSKRLKVVNKALEHSLNGFDIVNQKGLFVYVNQAYVKIWGYDSEKEILGTSPASHCADPEMPKEIIKQIKEHGSFNGEFMARRKDGSLFRVHMAAYLDHDENGDDLYFGSSLEVPSNH